MDLKKETMEMIKKAAEGGVAVARIWTREPMRGKIVVWKTGKEPTFYDKMAEVIKALSAPELKQCKKIGWSEEDRKAAGLE